MNDRSATAAPGMRYLHNLFETGPVWEQLIDHPAWIHHMHRYCGSPAGAPVGSGLYLDENFAIVMKGSDSNGASGGATPLHSGGHKRRVRTQFRYHDGEFRCGQISLLVALTDIGEGDGATIVVCAADSLTTSREFHVYRALLWFSYHLRAPDLPNSPGSHKSNIAHPALSSAVVAADRSAELVEEGIEVHLGAGDCLLLVDCMLHGSGRKRTPGERRVFVTVSAIWWLSGPRVLVYALAKLSSSTLQRQLFIAALATATDRRQERSDSPNLCFVLDCGGMLTTSSSAALWSQRLPRQIWIRDQPRAAGAPDPTAQGNVAAEATPVATTCAARKEGADSKTRYNIETLTFHGVCKSALCRSSAFYTEKQLS